MKILFASGHMEDGGAQRVVSILANEFVSRDVNVSILVVRGISAFSLDRRVRLVKVYKDNEIKPSFFNKVYRRLVYHGRLVARLMEERPDIIIPVHGGGWNGLFILLARLLRIKVVAAEHISYKVKSDEMLRIFERNFIYRFVDALTVLTRADYAYYSSYLSNVRLLPNPLSFHVYRGATSRSKTILAAGRLNAWHHKGFDNLLRIFAEIAPKHIGWRLQIAGAGDEGLQYLRHLSRDLGIADLVDFIGFRDDIELLMRSSAIFVLSSRYEGFGMVLIEAMSQGCPCVSFDCESGPSDIINDGVDGLLIEDQNHAEMARALSRLMTDETLRRVLSEGGVEKASYFAATAIADCWIDLLGSLVATSGKSA